LNRDATRTYPDRIDIAGGGSRLAMAIETTVRTVAGRYNCRAGELQILLPDNHGVVGICGSFIAAVVVIPEVIFLLEREKLELYESMLFWFVKEFVKAILGLGLVLAIIVFLRWLNTDDNGASDDK
jgi:hypothetical protein